LRRTLITNRARALRKAKSQPEVMLWTRLRGRGPHKPTFRRQHPFGSIILDFYCPAAKLAVEVDGSTHWDEAARARDAARDRWLQSQGVSVLRTPASEVFRDLTGAADGVILRAEARIAAERQRTRLAPSTARSPAGGPPPAAPRGGRDTAPQPG
jgi:very-short-patch-repair endonuclease